MQSWIERHSDLASLADRHLFFVDGQPRSGTTWLQQLLDAHPAISCKGEAQFRDLLAAPLDAAMRQRYQELHERNGSIFAHTGGYTLPVADDTQYLLGTAILQSFRRQIGDRDPAAIGEKTPGNIFFFPQLRSLFPGARLIAIARDPRDVITSNWHRFQYRPGATEADRLGFVRRVLPMANSWMRAMLAARDSYGDAYRLVTYESLCADPAPVLAGLYRFLGVSDDDAIVDASVRGAAFAVQTGGRHPGDIVDGVFHRAGVPGSWRSTLTGEMNRLVLAELGWCFAAFGWPVE